MANEEKNEQEMWDPASQSLSEALDLSLRILKIVMVLLIFLFLGSGVFMVEQNQVAVVLRFGKIQGTKADRILKPGLHWTWPYPLSEVIKLESSLVKTIEIDDFWYRETEESVMRKRFAEKLDPEIEGYCLSGDANIVHSRWQLDYIIDNPYDFLRQTEFVDQLVRDLMCSCIIEAKASFEVQDLINRKDELRRIVYSKIESRIAQVQVGIKIQTLSTEVVPPKQVEDAFESVILAEQVQTQKLEEARNFQTQLLNKARGEYAQILADANNYALEVINEAKSDASYFKSLLSQYSRYPEIFRERQYLKVLEKLRTKTREVFLLHPSQMREVLIRINSNPDLRRTKPAEQEE